MSHINVTVRVFDPSSQPAPTGCSTITIPIPLSEISSNIVVTNIDGTTFVVNGVQVPFGTTLALSTNYPVLNCDGTYRVVQNTVEVIAIDTHDASDHIVQGNLHLQNGAGVQILRPAIACTNFCNTLGSGASVIITSSGSVSNSGNIALTNVMVFNDKPIPGTLVTNFGDNVLAPGAVFACSNFYPAACGTTIDTITVTGTELDMGQPVASNVTSSSSSTCLATINPSIAVVTSCPPDPVPPGASLIFSGVVSNTGNITLTNVIVLNQEGNNISVVIGPRALAPGEYTNFTKTYLVPPDSCGPYADTFLAYGTSVCGGAAATSQTISCPGAHQANITVSKNCSTNAAVLDATNIISGVVSNSGNITLTNVTVIDDQAGEVLANTVLAPGEAVAYVGMYLVTNCGPNVASGVAASGDDMCLGLVVSNRFDTTCAVPCPPIPPYIFESYANETNFVFSFATETNRTYTIEFADSLTTLNWQTFTTLPGNGAVATIQATITNAQSFYRVLTQ